ncbi:hypothetical protein AAMO2058_001077300 [Amorphochlora amoebiformis]
MRPRSMVAAAGVIMVLPLVCVLGNGLGAGGKRMGWGLAAQRISSTSLANPHVLRRPFSRGSLTRRKVRDDRPYIEGNSKGYSFGDEIDRWNEQQRELEKKGETVPPPQRYSFDNEREDVMQPSPSPALGPPSWETGVDSYVENKPEATDVMEKGDNPMETEEVDDDADEYEMDQDEEDMDIGEPPYLVSDYQSRFWVAPRYIPSDGNLDSVLDERAMLKRSQFILPKKVMMSKAQELLESLVEGDADAIEEQLADDFEFIGPVVGPLDIYRPYMFKVKEALPDIKENVFGFTVDPMEPNRVWWFSRSIGTHTGQFGGSIPATGNRIEWPPEVNSMCFDDEGNVYRLTLGYAVDRMMGNTGGLGAVFGLLNAIGRPLPFREAQPWRPSAKFLFFTRAMPRLRDLLKKGKEIRDGLLDSLDDEEQEYDPRATPKAPYDPRGDPRDPRYDPRYDPRNAPRNDPWNRN